MPHPLGHNRLSLRLCVNSPMPSGHTAASMGSELPEPGQQGGAPTVCAKQGPVILLSEPCKV